MLFPSRGLRLRSRTLLRLPRTDSGNSLGDRNLQPRRGPGSVVKFRNGDTWKTPTDGALDVAEISFLVRRNERECFSSRFGSTGSAYAMDVIVRRQRHV